LPVGAGGAGVGVVPRPTGWVHELQATVDRQSRQTNRQTRVDRQIDRQIDMEQSNFTIKTGAHCSHCKGGHGNKILCADMGQQQPKRLVRRGRTGRD
jgi:hypothetical protein